MPTRRHILWPLLSWKVTVSGWTVTLPDSLTTPAPVHFPTPYYTGAVHTPPKLHYHTSLPLTTPATIQDSTPPFVSISGPGLAPLPCRPSAYSLLLPAFHLARCLLPCCSWAFSHCTPAGDVIASAITSIPPALSLARTVSSLVNVNRRVAARYRHYCQQRCGLSQPVAPPTTVCSIFHICRSFVVTTYPRLYREPAACFNLRARHAERLYYPALKQRWWRRRCRRNDKRKDLLNNLRVSSP